ncbi:MFS transporter [Arthrobacter sp. 2MCAF15]|uniref:MFS transporter n=1 Tax=Arthrobacter sp. 2MCAF15 TaxID=3232984 RepID=UPI003F8DB7EA
MPLCANSPSSNRDLLHTSGMSMIFKRGERTSRGSSVRILIIVFVDALYFSILTPLLPSMQTEFGLDSAATGQLTAAYLFGILIGIFPAGLIVPRVGSRWAAVGGVVVMGAAGISVGLSETFANIVASRVLQGLGSAVAWAGAMAWMTASVPIARLGQGFGNMLAASFVGAFIGPLLGGVALITGRPVAFGLLAGLCLVLNAGLLLLAAPPGPAPRSPSGTARVRTTRFNKSLAAAIFAVSAFAGGRFVLPPLMLARDGTSGESIALLYSGSGLIMAVVAFLAGRAVTGSKRHVVVFSGLTMAFLAATAFVIIQGPSLVMALVILAGCAIQWSMTGGFAAMTQENQAAGLEPSMSWAYLNVVWTGGFLAGSLGTGWMAAVSSDKGAWALLAGCIAVSSLLSFRVQRSERLRSSAPKGKRSVGSQGGT